MECIQLKAKQPLSRDVVVLDFEMQISNGSNWKAFNLDRMAFKFSTNR